MNLNKFTIKSQEALQNGQEIASSYGNQILEPEHVLAALVQDPGGTVLPILGKIGVNAGTLKLKVNELLERLPKVSGAALGQQGMSQALGRVLDAALKQAQGLHDEYVSTEHILLGLLDAQESPAGRLLKEQGVTSDAVLLVL